MNYIYENKWIYINTIELNLLTIQDFYNNYIPSKKVQHLLLQNKHILIDGTPVKRETLLDSGKFLSILIYPNETIKKTKKLEMPNIIYEDELILIVDKPNGMLVHNDGSNLTTLTDIVRNYLPNYCEALPIHRLDKETLGLVMFSKSSVFHPLLDSLINERKISRKYLALALGKLPNKAFTISKPIGKNRHDAKKMIISRTGDKAITRVKEVKIIDQKYSLIECVLLTGKTHQIRVHLASIGCPIINDNLYGVKSTLIANMGLIAYKLEFNHPITDEIIIVKSKFDII